MGAENFTDWTVSLELKTLTVVVESNLIFLSCKENELKLFEKGEPHSY